MPTKFAHCSDLHNQLLKLPDETKFVINSGDFMPNKYRTDLGGKDTDFQKQWLKQNLIQINDWMGNKPQLFLTGNHDRFNPADFLSLAGLNAINIDDRYVTVEGIKIYGITGIPYIDGEWNTELRLQDMADKFTKIDKIFNDQGFPDILVCHSPPYGILDNVNSFIHLGNTILTNYLNYNWKDKMPKFVLFGHIHESFAEIQAFNTTFSNAATGVRVLEFGA